MRRERLRSPGGTSGGLGGFLLGLVMAVAGGYLFIDRVTVLSSPWELFGMSGYSLSLVPLIFGIFWLFFDGRSILAWLLTVAGIVIIFAGVISHLTFFFRPTSLFNTIVMLVLLFGGLGLIARAVFPPRRSSRADTLAGLDDPLGE
jgi:predicted membrane channel-forming protein YqfA (hemolysin III family)